MSSLPNARRLQIFDRYGVFAHRSVYDVHTISPGTLPGGDDAVDLAADKVYRGPVIDGKAGGDLTVAQQPMVGWAALGFAAVVGATTAGKKAETIKRPQLIRPGIRHALLEPADGPGADPGQDSA